jgi:hypothetical protein
LAGAAALLLFAAAPALAQQPVPLRIPPDAKGAVATSLMEQYYLQHRYDHPPYAMVQGRPAPHRMAVGPLQVVVTVPEGRPYYLAIHRPDGQVWTFQGTGGPAAIKPQEYTVHTRVQLTISLGPTAQARALAK